MKVSAFEEEVGELKSFFSYSTGGGASVNYGATNKVWECTSDGLGKPDDITGEVAQSQTWQYLGTPELVSTSTYSTPLPAPE